MKTLKWKRVMEAARTYRVITTLGFCMECINKEANKEIFSKKILEKIEESVEKRTETIGKFFIHYNISIFKIIIKLAKTMAKLLKQIIVKMRIIIAAKRFALPISTPNTKMPNNKNIRILNVAKR